VIVDWRQNRQRTQRTLRPRDFRTSEFWTVDWQSGNYPDVPAKSGFEQVHRVGEFGGLNLVKNPFFIRVVAARAGTIWILKTQPRQRR
jgi:hypothetical protein